MTIKEAILFTSVFPLNEDNETVKKKKIYGRVISPTFVVVRKK